MCCCHCNQHLWDVAMATRVLCIVAMETVTVQIQYLRRCSWSHKVATPSLVNLHVHINHTAVHLHLNLKRSRITTYYTTTPNTCLLWYFTRRMHDIVGVSQEWVHKGSHYKCEIENLLSFQVNASFWQRHKLLHPVGLTQPHPLKATNQYEGQG